MKQWRFQAAMVAATMLAFVAMLAANTWLFARFELVPGINWIYLPAGMRLLCVLLFGDAGVLGLLLVSWLVCFFYFFPDDYLRSFMGGVLAAAAPWLANRVAQQALGLRATLTNLSPARLLACILMYSLASPLLHHLWFAVHGDRQHLLHSFLVMFVGDLTGTLIVVYTAKGLLALLPAPRGAPVQSLRVFRACQSSAPEGGRSRRKAQP
ncbi:MAG: hypothetical protein QFF03_22160 [Pseudomonadota bacterium]|nr:hypothetical protein [Pseudomonadota bacterium]